MIFKEVLPTVTFCYRTITDKERFEMSININQTVTWTSQSHGSEKTKTGTVVAIIEPGEDARKYMPAGLPKTQFKGDRFSTNRHAPPVRWLE